MKYLSVAALLIAGLIHLMPIPGLSGAAMLQRLYGIDITDPNTAILLQHRAILFGIVGVLLLSAVHWPSLRILASTIGLFSALSFIAIALRVGGYNEAIGRVVIADIVACVLLLAGLVAELLLRSSRAG